MPATGSSRPVKITLPRRTEDKRLKKKKKKLGERLTYSSLSKNLTFLILDLLQQLFHGDGPRCAQQKNHLTPVNWKLHRKTALFPILTVHFPAPLFKLLCSGITMCDCSPDFPSSPVALWGDGQWWLEAILPQQSGGPVPEHRLAHGN